MKKFLIVAGMAVVAIACSNNAAEKKETETTATGSNPTAEEAQKAQKDYDATKGVGKFTKVDLGANLDKKMADGGKKVYEMKCMSCHKLSDEKLVGPGWKEVTHRRTPEWVMNFVTNTDEMLNKDANAQALLEVCMVRMPNQNLTDTDARSVLEFMRENDGVK
jgi:cytochrome c551/c552